MHDPFLIIFHNINPFDIKLVGSGAEGRRGEFGVSTINTQPAMSSKEDPWL